MKLTRPHQPLVYGRLGRAALITSPYGLCFGVLASRVAINCSAAGGAATTPARTISLAGISLPYTRRLSPLSGRMVEPSRETPANRPRALEKIKISAPTV